jgi:hypothetical protein
VVLVALATACGFIEQEPVEPAQSDRELALIAECREADDVALSTHKYAVCHTPAGEMRDPYTMLLSAEARDFHLAHGDTEGGCGCEEVDSSVGSTEGLLDTGEAEAQPTASTGDTADYCDANQYRCKHNWGCPDQHICDLGCCVYVISWTESLDEEVDETEEEESGEVSGSGG